MSNQKLQRKYWSHNLDVRNLGGQFSKKRFNLKEELDFYFSPEQEYALKQLWGEQGPHGKRILEIGCGLGVFALFLAIQEAEVVVVDISLERLKFLKNQSEIHGLAERITIVCGAAESLPFKEDNFDAVYTKSVLIHTNQENASRETVRVLKKEGMAIFVEPLKYNPFAFLYRTFWGPKEWKSITTYFDRKLIRKIAIPFGMVKVRSFYLFGFLSFFFQFGVRNLKLFRFFVKVFNELDRIIFSLCPPLKRLAWFAVIHGKKSHTVEK